MAVTGCIRPCLVILNCLFWVIGLFLVGFTAWTMATNPALTGEFVSGTRYFTYTILSAGSLITIAGLFGCIGGLKEGTCLLKTYAVFVIIILLIEIAGAVAAYMLREKLHNYRDSGWLDFNTDTKNFLQTELKCCGFHNYTEYTVNTTDLPDSCFNDTKSKIEANIHSEGCWSKIDQWLNGNMGAWVGAVGGVAAVEILCMAFAFAMLYKINEAGKVSARSSHDDDIDDMNDHYRRGYSRGGGGGSRGYYKGGGGRHRGGDDYY